MGTTSYLPISRMNNWPYLGYIVRERSPGDFQHTGHNNGFRDIVGWVTLRRRQAQGVSRRKQRGDE